MDVFYLTSISVDKLKALQVQDIDGITLKGGKRRTQRKIFPIATLFGRIPNCGINYWSLSISSASYMLMHIC